MADKKFEEDKFMKSIVNLKDTQESIQSLSGWCIRNRKFAYKIARCWLKVIKKVKIDQKLVLFYLVNDVLQHSKKRDYSELLEKFRHQIKEAMPHLKDEKIASKVERCLSIWGEREVFDADFIKELSVLIDLTPTQKEDQEIVENFQPQLLCTQIKIMKALEDDTDYKLKTLKENDLDGQDIEEMKLKLKDKHSGDEYVKEFEDGTKKMEYYIKAMEREITKRRQVIELLGQGEKYYDSLHGEAEIVSTAYNNFGNRVKKLKLKLEEKLPELKNSQAAESISVLSDSPIPSPDYDAPSPGGDDDMELHLPGEENVQTPPPMPYNPDISMGRDFGPPDLDRRLSNMTDFSPSMESMKFDFLPSSSRENYQEKVVPPKVQEKDNNMSINEFLTKLAQGEKLDVEPFICGKRESDEPTLPGLTEVGEGVKDFGYQRSREEKKDRSSWSKTSSDWERSDSWRSEKMESRDSWSRSEQLEGWKSEKADNWKSEKEENWKPEEADNWKPEKSDNWKSETLDNWKSETLDNWKSEKLDNWTSEKSEDSWRSERTDGWRSETWSEVKSSNTSKVNITVGAAKHQDLEPWDETIPEWLQMQEEEEVENLALERLRQAAKKTKQDQPPTSSNLISLTGSPAVDHGVAVDDVGERLGVARGSCDMDMDMSLSDEEEGEIRGKSPINGNYDGFGGTRIQRTPSMESRLSLTSDHTRIPLSGDRSSIPHVSDHSRIPTTSDRSSIPRSSDHPRIPITSDHSRNPLSGDHSGIPLPPPFLTPENVLPGFDRSSPGPSPEFFNPHHPSMDGKLQVPPPSFNGPPPSFDCPPKPPPLFKQPSLFDGPPPIDGPPQPPLPFNSGPPEPPPFEFPPYDNGRSYDDGSANDQNDRADKLFNEKPPFQSSSVGGSSGFHTSGTPSNSRDGAAPRFPRFPGPRFDKVENARGFDTPNRTPLTSNQRFSSPRGGRGGFGFGGEPRSPFEGGGTPRFDRNRGRGGFEGGHGWSGSGRGAWSGSRW